MGPRAPAAQAVVQPAAPQRLHDLHVVPLLQVRFCRRVVGVLCLTVLLRLGLLFALACATPRQKTTDVKTHCPCGDSRKAPPGGRGRGVWCGYCLEMRMGENLDEVLANPSWRCPICREICNCSNIHCQRAKSDLAPTATLHPEAVTYGWDSVAHYLILTELREGRALEMVEREVDER